MTMVRKIFAVAAVAATGAAALIAATAATAAVLVVRSSGPSAGAYPPGKALPETHMLQLKASDTIVLLDSRGTRTLQGPGNFSVSASAAPVPRTAPRRTRRALVEVVPIAPAATGAALAETLKLPGPWSVRVPRESSSTIVSLAFNCSICVSGSALPGG